ncbi:MAG TPA: ATP-binding protein, partial [Coleofasciculaceae cyanobacterium]
MTTAILSTVQDIQRRAASLLLYQSVLEDTVGRAFLDVLQALSATESEPDPAGVRCLRAYGHWFNAMASAGLGWQAYLIAQILKADNPFSRQAQRADLPALSESSEGDLPEGDLPKALLAAARQDLRSLQVLYTCSPQKVSQWVQAISGLPTAPVAWDQPTATLPAGSIGSKLETSEDWATLLEPLAAHYRQVGTGVFATYRAFRWQSNRLMGISYPDPIRLQHLTGYEWQKAALVQNTEALLAGYAALHVLLYGSRGSGKSSLVKGLLHEYGDRGLRLIEVTKADLQDLPAIADQLRLIPQKFIIFVDDLSFEEDEDAYKALKVVLEGNLTARPQNIVVYATSNRRHLIREFFGDRPAPRDGDEIHAWDTVQEKLSFSDRFGLTLTFEPADQTTYLSIVHHLAQQAALAL